MDSAREANRSVVVVVGQQRVRQGLAHDSKTHLCYRTNPRPRPFATLHYSSELRSLECLTGRTGIHLELLEPSRVRHLRSAAVYVLPVKIRLISNVDVINCNIINVLARSRTRSYNLMTISQYDPDLYGRSTAGAIL